MTIEINQVTITLTKTEEQDDIYCLCDILKFYQDYCAEHPERLDTTSHGKRELVQRLIGVLDDKY